MFSADFNVPGWGTPTLGFDTSASGPLFGSDPTPEPGDYGPAGGISSGVERPFFTGSFWDFMASDWAPGSQRHLVDPTGPLLPIQIGPGGANRATIAAERRAAEAAEYVSDIPGEIGEAGGEFVAELGAGVGSGIESVLTGATEPLTAIPGDLLGDIPIWVPLLAGAFILAR